MFGPGSGDIDVTANLGLLDYVFWRRRASVESSPHVETIYRLWIYLAVTEFRYDTTICWLGYASQCSHYL